jgi:hypothetical protein
MKPRQPGLDDPTIDALYGLEPVIDPSHEHLGSQDAEAARFTTVQCPYCGEPFETLVDYSAGSSSYIEDCQVCCQPIEFNLDVAPDGELNSIRAQRSD